MIQFTLIVVPPDWQIDLPVPFNKATHDIWRDRLESGTRIIFYHPEQQAIVGEGEVNGFFIRPAEWPASSSADLPASVSSADYALPVRVLFQRAAESLIPLSEVRRVLKDETFPINIGEIRELDSAAYDDLRRDWP